MPEAIAGVVVTYFPDGAITERIAAIRREVGPLLIVDNTTSAEARDSIESLALHVGAIWLPQPGNTGTAGALNTAFTWLAARGHRAAIVFDQDSTPGAGLASALQRLASTQPTAAVIGSNWRDAARPDLPSRHVVRGRMRRRTASTDLAGVVFAISSGSWFSLRAWAEVGPFDERLFLDLVDTEYCLRAARAGWTISIAAEARLLHHRGSKSPVRWCGRTWWPANMPASRLHLLARNRVFVLRRYGLFRMSWASFEIAHSAYLLFCALILEADSGRKVHALFAGLRDGLLGRLGTPTWAEATASPSAVGKSRQAPLPPQ